jgi:hypothetical protein
LSIRSISLDPEGSNHPPDELRYLDEEVPKFFQRRQGAEAVMDHGIENEPAEEGDNEDGKDDPGDGRNGFAAAL